MKRTKLIISLVCAIIMLASLNVTTFALAGTENKEDYFLFAADVIEDYYRNRENCEFNQLTSKIDNAALDLLEAKIEMTRYKADKLDIVRNNYDVEVIPVLEDEWVYSNNSVLMKLQVLRTWNYDNCNEQTSSSELLTVLVSNDDNNLIIEECYIDGECTRFGTLDIDYMDSLKERTANNFLNDYVNEYKEQCDILAEEYSLKNKNTVSVNKIEDNTRTVGYFDREAMRDWARNNYNKATPVSSSSSISYYDFSEITNSYDCTNFASHAILAGGATMHDDGASGITGTNQWYFRNINNRSSSWSGVDQLKQFLTRSNPGSNNVGPYAEVKELTYANAYYGDLVQFHNGTIWRHTTVVTSYTGGQIRVTGRTNDYIFDDNILPEERVATEIRLVHLINNHS